MYPRGTPFFMFLFPLFKDTLFVWYNIAPHPLQSMLRFLFRRRRYPPPRRRFTPDFSVSPETKKSIIVVLLFLFGIVTTLSLFGIAGRLGEVIIEWLSFAVGRNLVFLLSFLSWVTAVLMLFPDRFELNAANYLGLLLLLFAVTGLAHLTIPEGEALSAAREGLGGGFIGYGVSYPAVRVAGTILTMLAGIVVILVSIILIFNTSLARIAALMHLATFVPISYAVKNISRFLKGLFALAITWVREARERRAHLEGEEPPMASDNGELLDPLASWEAKAVSESGDETRAQTEARERVQPALISLRPRRKHGLMVPLDILDEYRGKPTSGDIANQQEVIKASLASFGIPVEMGEVTVGPTITRFTLKPATGVKLSKISALTNDLALALAAHPIRIEAPIPGQSLVGIEVPNKAVALVKLKSLLESEPFQKRSGNLMVAIGRDVSGTPWIENLSSMPHMLVAGATGSGKSVCLNTIIISLLFQNHPDELKFLLIDPKRVELPVYNSIPHILTPVITDIPKVVNALKWCLREMDRRFEVLSQAKKRNIADYNSSNGETLPYIVIIIDELADLMAVAAAEVEGAIIRLAQMARAVGIHLIVATQRPSVDVITGLIKANITTRIAFSVAASSDSRTILDTSGAEKLLGRGDMLYVSATLSKPRRLQGAFLSDEEIHRIVNYISSRFEQHLDASIIEKQVVPGGVIPGMAGEELDDEALARQAIEEIRRSQKASTTFLQRRLRVGYARAARIIDLLEQRGMVGPADGAKPRDILLAKGEDDTLE